MDFFITRYDPPAAGSTAKGFDKGKPFARGTTMPTALVTGANRGIGLEFVRQYTAEGWTVHAGVRDPDAGSALDGMDLKGGSVHRLDVENRDHIAALAGRLDSRPIDLLINNAGMWLGDDERYGRFSDEQWMREFRVHVFATMAICEALVDNVAASERKLIVNISSAFGSLGLDRGISDYPYDTSKAALNMITKGLAHDLADRGITVICFSPGHVATDMSGPAAPLSPEESISGMRRVIGRLDRRQSGTFIHYNGEPVPW